MVFLEKANMTTLSDLLIAVKGQDPRDVRDDKAKIVSMPKVTFLNCVPTVDTYNDSDYSKWSNYKFSEGDVVECANTLNLTFVHDAEVDRILQGKKSIYNYNAMFQNSDDWKLEEPNSKFLYLGKVIYLANAECYDQNPFYKFLDVKQTKIKWFREGGLKTKIIKGFQKTFTIRRLKKSIDL